jgi:hypothetical protein
MAVMMMVAMRQRVHDTKVRKNAAPATAVFGEGTGTR